MTTVKFRVSDLKTEQCEKIILEKLREADGILDVSMDSKTKEVTLSINHASACEGAYCIVENLGYKVHRP